ncbi:MAG: hypothetical protein JST22_01605 [Bacteroidetes bacterium]|nr:hypothetical protein [Bacteroidota bacterium]
MAKATGIHTHRFMKLGKAPARTDVRNLRLATLLRAVPLLPDRYDFDQTHPEVPLPMFANDVVGDCVIAGRAHQTLRFEEIEQGKIVPITDEDVRSEYFAETGGADDGLVVLDSLKLWRSAGWLAGGERFFIKAFAEMDPRNHNEVRQAVFADVGIGIGLRLPLSAFTQRQAGQPWDVTEGPDSVPGSWGGHYVYVSGYTPAGPVCVTWATKQQMTWAWLDAYCDEAYAIFDARDSFKRTLIDKARIDAFLAAL